MLYIVATPIGNLSDISLRALEILKSVDYILCEDTRVTRKLLDKYDIKNKKLESCHQHSNKNKIIKLINLIKKNNIALVTDAGTPGISDPGNKLIKELLNLNYTEIIPIPGASAVTTALSISGLPTDKFLFLGFVPHKKHRQKFLQQVLDEKITVVFYESKHRILKTLEFLYHPEVFTSKASKRPMGSRCNKHFVVCRELSKKFETIYRGIINEVLEQVKNDVVKGEYVVVVG